MYTTKITEVAFGHIIINSSNVLQIKIIAKSCNERFSTNKTARHRIDNNSFYHYVFSGYIFITSFLMKIRKNPEIIN